MNWKPDTLLRIMNLQKQLRRGKALQKDDVYQLQEEKDFQYILNKEIDRLKQEEERDPFILEHTKGVKELQPELNLRAPLSNPNPAIRPEPTLSISENVLPPVIFNVCSLMISACALRVRGPRTGCSGMAESFGVTIFSSAMFL